MIKELTAAEAKEKALRYLEYRSHSEKELCDKLKKAGAKEEDIPKLVEMLCYGNGREGTISGFVELNEEDCANIYKLML